MSTKNQSTPIITTDAGQNDNTITINDPDCSNLTIETISPYNQSFPTYNGDKSSSTSEIAKLIEELEHVKNILYDRAKYYNSLSDPAKKLIPTTINARNTFLFQERLQLVVELGKVELNYLQEIAKVNKQIYDMVMKSKQQNSDTITEDQENIIVKKVINKIKKMV